MIKIELTVKQRKQLAPLFDAAKTASAAGKRGAIGAQIWPDGMCVKFFDGNEGRILSLALGADPDCGSCTAAERMRLEVPPNTRNQRPA